MAPAKKPPAEKAPAKKAPAKQAAARKAPAKQATARKATARKAPTKQAAAKKAPAEKAPAKQAAAKRAPAEKAPAKQAAAKKAPAKQAVAKKAPAEKAPVKQASAKRAITPRRSASPGALLLAPGAGADRDHHTLVAVTDAVAPLPSERMDFPYRKAGKRAPDRAPVAIAAVVAEAEALVASTGIDPSRLVLGGRSFGGRMCSMAVAEGLPAAGLVLLSYPLHPPGRHDNLRTEHFALLEVPCLFVSGEKDPFGSLDEFAAAVTAIPGPVTQVWLPGGHDPRNADGVIADTVATWLASL